jgi:uncharacterized protein YoxC
VKKILFISLVVNFYLLFYGYFLNSEVKKQGVTIYSQNKTLEYLTEKYIGTKQEQQLLREANEMMDRRKKDE